MLIEFNFTDLPSLKNSKTIHFDRKSRRLFVATETKTKDKMASLTRSIRDAIQRSELTMLNILAGETIPLDDSIQWIGFPGFTYEMTNNRQCQFCSMNFRLRGNANPIMPHLFDVEVHFILYGNTNRDSDNIVSSLLDAYLDAVCDICHKTRQGLRTHATATYKKLTT